ncbi:MAG: 30S ribosomal protein S8 [Planctomycetota bacterium]
MMTDPIADMLTRIRNAIAARKPTVQMPASKQKTGIADVLKREGYIEEYQVAEFEGKEALKIYLKYGPVGESVIRELERVSKPGRREYRGVDSLPRVSNGIGTAVVSTSYGILSDRECRKKNVGGEVVCTVE